MNKEQLRNMTIASMMVAVFVVLHFTFPANNNVVQGFLSLISPIPIAIYSYISNLKHSIMIVGIGFTLSILFFDPILTITFILPSIVFGIVMGTFYKGKITWLKVIILMSLTVIFNLFELYVNYLITGVNLITLNLASINASIDLLKTYFNNIDEQILLDLNISLLPIMLILGGLFRTIVSCLITQIIIKRVLRKKVENKNIEYYSSTSIYIEVAVLLIYLITIVLWTLVLTNIIEYYFVFSVLLDIMLLVVIAYYGLIHKNITARFRDKKFICIIISLVYMSLFFFIVPIAALKKIIINRWKI